MMRVFIQELKKILRPVPVAVLALFSAVYSLAFFQDPFRMLTVIHENSDFFAVVGDLAGVCGPYAPETQEEFDKAVETLTKRYTDEAGALISSNEVFRSAGITDFAGFEALRCKIEYSRINPDDFGEGSFGLKGFPPYDRNTDYTLTPQEAKIRDSDDLLYLAPTVRLRALREWYAESYERIGMLREAWQNPTFPPEDLPRNGVMRIREIVAGKEIMGIAPTGLESKYIWDIFSALSVMAVITLCALLAPVTVRDKMAGIARLQYSSRAGRRTPAVQLAAMLASAFIVCVIEAGAVLASLAAFVVKPFLAGGLNSFFDTSGFSWFTGSWAGYLLCVFAMLLAACFAVTLIVFFASRLSSNYISMLLCVVPVAAVVSFLLFAVFRNLFMFRIDGLYTFRSMYEMTGIPFVECYAVGFLLLAGAAGAGSLIARERRADAA